MLSLTEIDALKLSIKNLLQNESINSEEKDSLNKILRECLSSQYGIKWTQVHTNAFKELKNKYPVLDVVNDKDIIMDKSKPLNYLIEGENLYSLKCLESVYSNKIDVIYIDPPYNTKSDSFIYKDKFEHSEWLTFMEERLTIAYKLLSREGVIFISIDDNEQAALKLLCDNIFGESNFYGCFIQKKGNTQNDSKKIQRNHEYILCYTKNFIPLLLTYTNTANKCIITDEYSDKSYILGRDTGSSSGHDKLIERTNLGYTIYYKEEHNIECLNSLEECAKQMNLKYGNFNYYISKDNLKFIHLIAVCDYNKDAIYDNSLEEEIYTDIQELINNGYKKIRPPKRKGNKLGCWTWSLMRLQTLWNSNSVVIKNNKNVYQKKFINIKDIERNKDKNIFIHTTNLPLQSLIDISNSKGTTQLKGNKGIIPGCNFDNPKSVELIKYLIGSYNNKDALVLDFFAGSGTTGQAVLELNEEDGGNRRFILCTNNENNICEEITYERLKTVITGKRKDGSVYSDGITSNLKYLKSDILEVDEDEYDISYVLDEFKEGLIDLSELFSSEYLVLNDVLSTDLLESDLSNIKRVYIKDIDIMLDENWEKFKDKLSQQIEFIDIHFLFIK